MYACNAAQIKGNGRPKKNPFGQTAHEQKMGIKAVTGSGP